MTFLGFHLYQKIMMLKSCMQAQVRDHMQPTKLINM